MSIQLIVDSTCDVSASIVDRLTVVPLTVRFGAEEFLDGVTISKDAFYHKLTEGKDHPATSQPSPSVFTKIYQEVVERGDQALVITVASQLSGTYQSACLAAMDFPGVRVVDSGNATIGAGILIEYAQSCIDRGMELEAIVEELEARRGDVCVLAVLDTLEYLKRGGRISGAAALAGTVLNIKPVAMIQDGVISVLGKARGLKKANNFLAEEIHTRGVESHMPVLLGYTGASSERLDAYKNDSREIWSSYLSYDPNSTQIGSVVGTHAGPGAVGVAFFRKHAV